CVIQNTPNAETSAGTITAPRVPVQPYWAIRMYRGTIPSCTGTAMVAKTATNSTLLPLKRNFAKAKPAKVDSTTVETETVVETMIELVRAFQKFTAGVFITVCAFSMKLPPGNHDMLGSRMVLASP